MNYSIPLCLIAAAMMGCASVDNTAPQTTVVRSSSDTQAPPQTQRASPTIAHKLYEQGDYAAAFDMNYALATHGDDRSQYNIGVSYHNGIEGKVRRDYVEAYAWMLTSEMEIQKPTRLVGLKALKNKLSDEEQRVAQERAAALFEQHGSGDRVQSNLDLIVLVDSKTVRKSCSHLGSRLKRNCHGARQFKGRGELNSSPITGPGI